MNHTTLVCRVESEPRFTQANQQLKVSFHIECPTRVVPIKLFVLAYKQTANALHDMNVHVNDWLLLSGTLEGSTRQDQFASFVLIAKDVTRLEMPTEVSEQQAAEIS